MTVLEVDISRKVFEGGSGAPRHVAIEGLRFSLSAAEIVCLLGPSGCGKTTLLNMIAGLITDYEGRIAFGAGAGERLTYMFQQPLLLPWRTVFQNVDLARAASATDPHLTGDLIREVGLEKFAHAYPGQLSLGMQRRAALARAFVCRPALLLMDEPFVSLDEQIADQLRDLLIAVWRERTTTILFVTHDSREAIRLADRLLVLTAAPARLAKEVTVPLARDERSDPAVIESVRAALLTGS